MECAVFKDFRPVPKPSPSHAAQAIPERPPGRTHTQVEVVIPAPLERNFLCRDSPTPHRKMRYACKAKRACLQEDEGVEHYGVEVALGVVHIRHVLRVALVVQLLKLAGACAVVLPGRTEVGLVAAHALDVA